VVIITVAVIGGTWSCRPAPPHRLYLPPTLAACAAALPPGGRNSILGAALRIL
jgi:hypothetical protein